MVKRVRKTKSAKRTSRVKKKRVKTTSFLKDVSPLTLLLVGIVAAAVIYIYLSSSLVIVFNSARLVRFGEELDVFEDEAASGGSYETGAVEPVPTAG